MISRLTYFLKRHDYPPETHDINLLVEFSSGNELLILEENMVVASGNDFSIQKLLSSHGSNIVFWKTLHDRLFPSKKLRCWREINLPIVLEVVGYGR